MFFHFWEGVAVILFYLRTVRTGALEAMTMFLSTYVNKVDKKGRVSVPASFRAVLAAESFQGVVLIRSSRFVCLEGFAMSRMEELGRRVDGFDVFSGEQDDLATAIFAEAVQLPFDGDGRVMISAALLSHACIDSQAAFVGMGQKFQIWCPGLLEERRKEAIVRVKSDGLTVPGRGAA
jgi:MraZ protein